MKTFTAAVCLAASLTASAARAQQQANLTPPAIGQWDSAAQLALVNRNETELGGWDNWYSVAAVHGSAGRYWTPHLKTELDIGTAGQGKIGGAENGPASEFGYPYARYRTHLFHVTTLGAAAVYQFFENQWVHPFVGAGVELARERHTADALPPEVVRVAPNAPPVTLPAAAAVDAVRYWVRPLITGGFKFYVAPRAFIRTDVRTSLAVSGRPAALQWRGGIGFDW
jgi:hypothetical protein